MPAIRHYSIAAVAATLRHQQRVKLSIVWVVDGADADLVAGPTVRVVGQCSGRGLGIDSRHLADAEGARLQGPAQPQLTAGLVFALVVAAGGGDHGDGLLLGRALGEFVTGETQ